MIEPGQKLYIKNSFYIEGSDNVFTKHEYWWGTLGCFLLMMMFISQLRIIASHIQNQRLCMQKCMAN